MGTPPNQGPAVEDACACRSGLVWVPSCARSVPRNTPGDAWSWQDGCSGSHLSAGSPWQVPSRVTQNPSCMCVWGHHSQCLRASFRRETQKREDSGTTTTHHTLTHRCKEGSDWMHTLCPCRLLSPSCSVTVPEAGCSRALGGRHHWVMWDVT